MDIKSMFDSMRESLKQGESTQYKDILRMKVGSTYLVRLIPNVKAPEATFFNYYHHGFNSNETGQYVDVLCPATFKEKCNVCRERFRLFKKGQEGDEASKNLSNYIRRMEKHLVNVYVINDPDNEENNGTVKVLRFGSKIKEKFDLAMNDPDEVLEFGPRIFDLSENGCTLKIKVESQSEGKKKFTDYSNTRFMSPSAIPGMTPEKMMAVYDGIYDLTKFTIPATQQQLDDMLKVHLYCNRGANVDLDASEEGDMDAPESSTASVVKAAVATVTAQKAPAPAELVAETAPKSATEAKLKELMAGLKDVGE